MITARSRELLKQVIAANPGDQVAKNLQANKNFEELGYWKPSPPHGAVRRTARELREGVHKFSHGTTGSPDTIRGMSVEMLFDFMAVRLDSAKAAGKNISLNFNMSNGDNLNLTLNDSVLNYRKTLQSQLRLFYISREDSSRRADRASQNGGSGKSEESQNYWQWRETGRNYRLSG